MNSIENELMQRLIERYLSAHHTFAVDLPNGMKAGEVLRLRGKSVFEKKGEKRVRIEDHS